MDGFGISIVISSTGFCGGFSSHWGEVMVWCGFMLSCYLKVLGAGSVEWSYIIFLFSPPFFFLFLFVYSDFLERSLFWRFQFLFFRE